MWIGEDNGMYEQYGVALREESKLFYEPADEDDERKKQAGELETTTQYIYYVEA